MAYLLFFQHRNLVSVFRLLTHGTIAFSMSIKVRDIMVSVVLGQLIGIPTPIVAVTGVVEVILLTGLISVAAERLLFRMPPN